MELVDRLTYRGPRVLAGILFALILLVVGAIMMTGSQQSSANDPLAAPQAFDGQADGSAISGSVLAQIERVNVPSGEPASPQADQAQQPATPSTRAGAANSSKPDPTGEPFPTSTSAGPGSSTSVPTGSTTGTTTVPGSNTSTTTTGSPTTLSDGTCTNVSQYPCPEPGVCPPNYTKDPDGFCRYHDEPTTSTLLVCNSTPGYPDPCNGGSVIPCPGGYRQNPLGGCLMILPFTTTSSTTTPTS